MTYKTIVVEERGPLSRVTLNRPQRLNAITPLMADELADYFARLRRNDTVRVVVLRGEGRAFCAGLDIKAVGEPPEPGMEGRGHERLWDLVRDMRKCPQTIIAGLHGAASGGGFAMALAADIRIADPTAKMNVAFVKLGLSGCELGVTYLLPRFIGASAAMELMLTGNFIEAERARELGLVSRVVSTEAMDGAIDDLVESLLSVQPQALRRTKESFNVSLALSGFQEVLELEEQTQASLMAGPNFGEALAAFAEGRKPNFD